MLNWTHFFRNNTWWLCFFIGMNYLDSISAISSNDFPLVSGTQKIQKIVLSKQITPNVSIQFASPNVSKKIGTTSPRKNNMTHILENTIARQVWRILKWKKKVAWLQINKRNQLSFVYRLFTFFGNDSFMTMNGIGMRPSQLK